VFGMGTRIFITFSDKIYQRFFIGNPDVVALLRSDTPVRPYFVVIQETPVGHFRDMIVDGSSRRSGEGVRIGNLNE
jgi:hypothetical protein